MKATQQQGRSALHFWEEVFWNSTWYEFGASRGLGIEVPIQISLHLF